MRAQGAGRVVSIGDGVSGFQLGVSFFIFFVKFFIMAIFLNVVMTGSNVKIVFPAMRQ
jgi:hypothetical protein